MLAERVVWTRRGGVSGMANDETDFRFVLAATAGGFLIERRVDRKPMFQYLWPSNLLPESAI